MDKSKLCLALLLICCFVQVIFSYECHLGSWFIEGGKIPFRHNRRLKSKGYCETAAHGQKHNKREDITPVCNLHKGWKKRGEYSESRPAKQDQDTCQGNSCVYNLPPAVWKLHPQVCNFFEIQLNQSGVNVGTLTARDAREHKSRGVYVVKYFMNFADKKDDQRYPVVVWCYAESRNEWVFKLDHWTKNQDNDFLPSDFTD